MYESTLAGAFLYSWGAHDHHHGLIGRNKMVLNAQNPLDSLLGDLVGKSASDRWFFAELKNKESGFASELLAKPQRAALLNLVAGDIVLTNISSRAHFAIWPEGRIIRAAEYASTAQPAAFIPSTLNLMRSKSLNFQDFYNELNLRSSDRHPLQSAIYAYGLGVPGETMLAYLKALIESNSSSINAIDEAFYIFAKVSPSKGITYFCGSQFDGLWNELQNMSVMTIGSRPNSSMR